MNNSTEKKEKYFSTLTSLTDNIVWKYPTNYLILICHFDWKKLFWGNEKNRTLFDDWCLSANPFFFHKKIIITKT